MTRTFRNQLEKDIKKSVGWKACHDSAAQRLMHWEEGKWSEWKRLSRRDRRLKFKKTKSMAEVEGGILA